MYSVISEDSLSNFKKLNSAELDDYENYDSYDGLHSDYSDSSSSESDLSSSSSRESLKKIPPEIIFKSHHYRNFLFVW